MEFQKDSLEIFQKLHQGRTDAYGVYDPIADEYETMKEALSLGQYKQHLEGKISLGIIPITAETPDGKCSYGIVDDDDHHKKINFKYDYNKLLQKIKLLRLPVNVYKSKSGGAHIALYLDKPYPAKDVRHILKKVAYQLCEGEYELFPKQDVIEKGKWGSFANLPYHNGNTRVLIDSEGKELNFEEAMLYASERIVSLDELKVFKLLAKKDFPDGRNNTLFSAKQFFKKHFPDEYKERLHKLNKLYDDPLTEQELNATVLAENADDYFDKALKEKKPTNDPTAWRQGTKAKDIRETEYEDIPAVVEGLIYTGVTFISGKSKIGKSFKALQLANAVETGGMFLGFKCAKGSVLHYSLEDGKRRNQSRWKTMGIHPTEAMYQFRDRKPKIPLLTMGLEEEIEDWIKNTPDAKLVIIDPYVKVKKTIGGYKLNAYENDNYNLQNIYTLANKYNIAIVFIHHTKKKSEDDVFDEMNGSAGIQSNADSMIVLSSNRKMGQNVVLSCIPKDAEQKEFEIALNAKCLWEYVGKPGEANRTKIQKTILDAVKKLESGGGAKASDIKDVVRKEDDSWTKEQIQVELTRLSDNGEVVKVTRGVYKSAPF